MVIHWDILVVVGAALVAGYLVLKYRGIAH